MGLGGGAGANVNDGVKLEGGVSAGGWGGGQCIGGGGGDAAAVEGAVGGGSGGGKGGGGDFRWRGAGRRRRHTDVCQLLLLYVFLMCS